MKYHQCSQIAVHSNGNLRTFHIERKYLIATFSAFHHLHPRDKTDRHCNRGISSTLLVLVWIQIVICLAHTSHLRLNSSISISETQGKVLDSLLNDGYVRKTKISIFSNYLGKSEFGRELKRRRETRVGTKQPSMKREYSWLRFPPTSSAKLQKATSSRR